MRCKVSHQIDEGLIKNQNKHGKKCKLFKYGKYLVFILIPNIFSHIIYSSGVTFLHTVINRTYRVTLTLCQICVTSLSSKNGIQSIIIISLYNGIAMLRQTNFCISDLLTFKCATSKTKNCRLTVNKLLLQTRYRQPKGL